MSEMREVVQELRQFAKMLEARPDIEVQAVTFEPEASEAVVAHVRESMPENMAEDLAVYCQEANGVEIKWCFKEPPAGSGHLKTVGFRESTSLYRPDLHFDGMDVDVMEFDFFTGEIATWIVQHEGVNRATLVFASAAEGASGMVAAPTVPDYFRQAMHSGMVWHWPRCFGDHAYVSYADSEEQILRFQKRPQLADEPAMGDRIHLMDSSVSSHGARGEVLAVEELTPKRREQLLPADEPDDDTCLLRVRLDVGLVIWVLASRARWFWKEDLYETLRDPNMDMMAALETDPVAFIENLVLATTPGAIRDDYPIAGVLASRPMDEVMAIARHLVAFAREADLHRWRNVRPSWREFSSYHLRAARREYKLGQFVMRFLQAVLLVAAYREPSRGADVQSLFDAFDFDEDLTSEERFRYQHYELDDGRIEPPEFSWMMFKEQAGLPEDEPFFCGINLSY